MQVLVDDLLELSRLQRDEIQGDEDAVNVPAMPAAIAAREFSKLL